MRTLTNDYTDCTLIRVEPDNPNSPFVVAQIGADPVDPTYRQALFFLQTDGTWIEEAAQASRPQEERFRIVFDTLADVMSVLGELTGAPEVERMELAAADIQIYIQRLKTSTIEQVVHTFLASYRASKRSE